MHSYAELPDELLEDPAAAFRHIAADAERQVASSTCVMTCETACWRA
jgi:hypothetical protein